MNTIEEILRSKNTLNRFIEVICSECNNKHNTKDLCTITHTLDGTIKCVNYERCMKNKCKTCEEENNCFNERNKQSDEFHNKQ